MLVMSDTTRRRVDDLANDVKALVAQVTGKPSWSDKTVPDKRSFEEHEAEHLVKLARRKMLEVVGPIHLGADAICFARLLEGTLAKVREARSAKETEAG